MHPVGALSFSEYSQQSDAPAVRSGRHSKSVRFDELGSPSSPEASTSSSSGIGFTSEDEADGDIWSNPTADGVVRDEASWAGSLPASQGLYDPENEKGRRT